MRAELSQLNSITRLTTTTVYVTHDQVEAMTMADKIVVLRSGRIEQVGSSLELYERPRNLFVAGFIGSPRMNTIPARIATVMGGAARVELPGGTTVRVPLNGDSLPPGPVVLGIRPEHVTLAEGGAPGRVTLAEHLGAETILHVDVAGATLLARTDGRAPQRIGDAVGLTLDPRWCHLFEPAGPALIHGHG